MGLTQAVAALPPRLQATERSDLIKRMSIIQENPWVKDEMLVGGGLGGGGVEKGGGKEGLAAKRAMSQAFFGLHLQSAQRT